MKKYSFLLLMILFFCNTIVKAENINTNNKEDAPLYSYNVYGDIPITKPVFVEKHFLGDELKDKWNSFQADYRKEYEVSIGLSDSEIQIIKPAIYNAVLKINKFYKKSYKNNQISKDAIIKDLGHILDCAIILSMEDNTDKLEKDLLKANSPQEIASIFKRIELVRL